MNTIKKRYTEGQIKLQGIIESLGFETILEKKFGDYFIDIFLPEIGKGIEWDSIGHYKKRDNKRDKILLNEYDIPVLRITDLKDKELGKKILEFCLGD